MLAECLWWPTFECEHSEAVVVHFITDDSGSGAPPLVQIVSTACRLLLIVGENAELVVVTVLKNGVF